MEPTPTQRAIRQEKPFRSPAQEAAVGLLLTADRVRRRFADALEPHGLTFQQYNVLRILRGAGKAGLPTLDLLGRLIEQAPGVTRLVDRLEEKGLVRRARGDEDRRQVVCRITPKGLDLLGRVDPGVERADDDCMAGLSAADQRRLVRLLDRVREGHA